MSIRSVIIALVNIFIPIYLYTVSYSIRQIIIFELIMFAGQAILEYPAVKIIARFGPKHAIAFSLPFLVFHFWLLWTIPTNHWPFWFIALTGSVALAFFWQAYHYDFSKSKKQEKATKEIRVIFVLIAILSAIAPVIGGYVADYYGISTLLGVVTGLVLASMFPLFVQREPHIKEKISLAKVYSKRILREQLSYGGNSIETSVSLIFWPIFMFILLGTYFSVGLVVALSSLVAVAVTYFIGHHSDRRKKIYYIGTGGILTATINIIRVFAYSFLSILFINIGRSITQSIYESPFVAEYYLHADEGKRTEYIFLMELGSDICRIIYFSLLLILSFYLGGRDLLAWALVIGAVGTTLITLMPSTKQSKNAIN